MNSRQIHIYLMLHDAVYDFCAFYVLLFAFNSDVPAAPSSVNVQSIQTSTAEVKWNTPVQGPAEGSILSHVLKYHVVGSPNNITTVSINSNPKTCQLSNLVLYTNYRVKIAAISSVGEGLWSTLDFTTDSACKLYLFRYMIQNGDYQITTGHVTELTMIEQA